MILTPGSVSPLLSAFVTIITASFVSGHNWLESHFSEKWQHNKYLVLTLELRFAECSMLETAFSWINLADECKNISKCLLLTCLVRAEMLRQLKTVNWCFVATILEFQVIRKTYENKFLQDFPEQSWEYKSTTGLSIIVMKKISILSKL